MPCVMSVIVCIAITLLRFCFADMYVDIVVFERCMGVICLLMTNFVICLCVIIHGSKFKLSAVLLLLLVISVNIHPPPGPTFDNLSICHINCRSLLAFDKETKSNTMKLEEIESILCTTGKFDIICMSETWLSSKTLDDEIRIENYTLHRRDRDSDCEYGILNVSETVVTLSTLTSTFKTCDL